jgi:hypothetical protein
MSVPEIAQIGTKSAATDRRACPRPERLEEWRGFPSRPSEPQAWWEPARVLRRAQSGVGVLPDGLLAGLVRHRRRALAALGNSIVPQVAEIVARRVMAKLAGIE